MSKEKEVFQFTHQELAGPEQVKERLFSVLPGFLSWASLISLTVLSFVQPIMAAVIIIAFDIYWLLRLFYMTIFLVIAYGILAIDQETDWMERCHHLEQGEKGLEAIRGKIKAAWKHKKYKKWLSYKNERREFVKVLESGTKIPDAESLYHLVLFPITREPKQVVEAGIQALTKSIFSCKRIIPVLAVEERAEEKFHEMARLLRTEYRDHFFDFLMILHPKDIPGEARVKGANVTYAAKQAAVFLRSKNIPFENVIVSCFDADTVAPPEYFAALTYHFMRNPDRLRSSYQPIPVYHNNIWEAPGVARVLEMGSSFFQLIEATNPEKLVTFSSHSMSFKALVEIDYWPVDMISDDSAIFWKALIHYEGDYHVVPMYVTLSMDVVMADTLHQTIATIYRQKRRWAWGVENFPVVMRAFCRKSKISLRKRWHYASKLLGMHISWATVGYIMTFIGWLPAIFAGREFSSSVLYYNSARITTLIFNLASTFLVVTIVMALLLLPRQKMRNSFLKRVVFALEWLLVPLVFTFLSTTPALDAQTRLMRGSTMEFQITEKKRRKKK
ncbi:MAG: glycosyltransferase family 2 protein [Candidatus Omnitrophica bacterium]|nr:glycosyltransferase family 2 protein [Candidatus Omnitrophota bacterium]